MRANTVLIADDEREIVQLIAYIIQKELRGVYVIGASDGVEALHQIERHSPSLLILDLAMPRKTGFDVLKELFQRGEKLPIIVISSYVNSKEEVAKLAEIESNRIEFLTKPFGVEDLLSMIRRLMPIHQGEVG